MGHEQTAHPGTTAPDFLRDALSPSIESSRLCPFSPLETLWRGVARPPTCSDLAAWRCAYRRIRRNSAGPVYSSLSTRSQTFQGRARNQALRDSLSLATRPALGTG